MSKIRIHLWFALNLAVASVALAEPESLYVTSTNGKTYGPFLYTNGATIGVGTPISAPVARIAYGETNHTASTNSQLPVFGETNTVRVAAVQCYSRMGEIDYNRQLLSNLVGKASEAGAKIIVLPECAVTGYMDPANDIKWTSHPSSDTNELDANKFAETVPGSSTEYFGKLSKKLQIYLCISLIEKSNGKLYNSQVLLDPEGNVCGHHRKTDLWIPGDGLWATEGDLPTKAVETKYGKLGLMICYEYHSLPKILAKQNVNIVLYSVGWYAPNTERWYKEIFPRNTVVPNNFSIIVANWSAEPNSTGWPGHGYSCIIDSSGKVLVMAKETHGEEIVVSDLSIGKIPPSNSTTNSATNAPPQ